MLTNTFTLCTLRHVYPHGYDCGTETKINTHGRHHCCHSHPIFKTSIPSFKMHASALLILAPIAAQAAQSARWPVFNLRANVTEDYKGYGSNSRATWHNAPLELGGTGGGAITGPLANEECLQRAKLNDHAPYSFPLYFYPQATSTGPYSPSEMAAGQYKMRIAQKNQKDANGRRAVVLASCGAGSTSIYISDTKPYHLTYDNKDAKKKENFGSFYLCKGDGYGDSLFYRSADETTPKDCGEVIFYPECNPLEYTVTTTQGTSNGTIDDGRDKPGHYNATCYVDIKDVTGAPTSDIAEWSSVPRTGYHPVGKIHV